MKRWGFVYLGVSSVLAVLACFLCGDAQAPGDTKAAEHFDKKVAPLLANRCLDCHSGSKPRGGLDLSRRKAALEGGDNGDAVVVGKAAASLVWKHVQAGKMPRKNR